MLDDTPESRLDTVLARLNDALEKGDADAAAALFQADSYWRDLVAFTWNLRTMEGPDQIRGMLQAQLPAMKPSNFRLDNAVKEGFDVLLDPAGTQLKILIDLA